MTASSMRMVATRRFWPILATVLLGATNDNVFKNALVILVLYAAAVKAPVAEPVLVTLAAGLFILPFFLFSATAGQLADKFDKARMVRWIKAAEVAIMAAGAAGLFIGNVWLLLGVLFLMGAQSAFFGPLKYSILPVLLKEDELVSGNAMVEAGTFLAILAGTIAGGLLILGDGGVPIVGALVLGLAALGWAASLAIPPAPAPQPDLALRLNPVSETARILRLTAAKRPVFLSVLGISWFWLVGATLISQFPNLARSVFNGDNGVVTLFLVVTTVGIGVGSMLCSAALKGEISARFVPAAALGMSVFLFDLWLASPEAAPAAAVNLAAFVAQPANWRVLGDLAAIALCGGFFTVPLYTIMQARSDAAERSQVIAGNNILNALFMVAGAVLASLALAENLSVPAVIGGLAAGNLLVALYICKLLPETVFKAMVAAVLKLLYRVELRGAENCEAAGERAVVVVNHVSFLDGILVGAMLPGRPVFAVDSHIARKWWARPLLSMVDVFPLDPTNPRAIRSLIEVVRDEKRHCVIFPEGRITVTGALMKINEGPGMIADKADAPVLPVRIDGAQYTPFSRLRGKVRTRWFPKITVTVLPPRRFEIDEALVGRARRHMAGIKLYDLMTDLMFDTANKDRTLFGALLDAARINGMGAEVIEDIQREPMSYRRLLAASHALGRRVARRTRPGERVGVLLPNAAGVAVTFFALHGIGRVPAMLNFSGGAGPMLSAVGTACIRTVLTSRRFIEQAKLQDAAEALGKVVELVWLEDLREEIGPAAKLRAMAASLMPRLCYRRPRRSPHDPAVVLFTSGSEGAPKGVVLSHRNILANAAQLAARVDFNASDIVFNALPVFHSFGMTGGLLLPLLNGIKTFLYPSPLHYRIIPALVYDINATILFGTDTFLSGYARAAHPFDFYSVRYVFAGAERVRDQTRQTWAEKFGLRLLEGYGATETAPVVTINTPMHYRAGTVGRFLPGIDWKLEKIEGIDEGGRLIVSGPNVMLGYLLEDAPGELQPPPDGRYDTGDIVSVDDEGFITIKGRAKRFAKVAGEMVSLGAVENMASKLWPEHAHAAVAVPDARKGEQVVLLTENADADRSALLKHAKENGVSELFVPRSVQKVDEIPLLGTGKTDYRTAAELAEGGADGNGDADDDSGHE